MSARDAQSGVVHVNGKTPASSQPLTDSEKQAQPSAATGAAGSTGNESPPRVPLKEEQANSQELDRSEDASMSPTLTAHKTPSTAHDKTAGSPTSAASKSGAGRKSKPSFFSKLIRALVPCITPSAAHPVEIDVPRTPKSPEPSSSTVKSEKVPEPVPEEQKPQEPQVPQVAEESAAAAPPVVPEPEVKSPENAENVETSVQVQEEKEVVPTPHLLPEEETEGATSGAVVPPGATGISPPTPERQHHTQDEGHESDGTSFTEDDDLDEPLDDDDEEDRLIRQGGAGIPVGPDGIPRPLLPPLAPIHAGRKCLVLDLDETLVHSSFKSISQADYVVPVEIEYHWHNVYVIKRPGVDHFLKKMGEIYEIVVFTASLSKYADPVLDKLDIHQVVSHRLFRESCFNHKGNYVKDLSQLGRPIEDTIILDNSPASYIFHPNNAVPVSSWFNDPHDTELTDLVPFLTDLAAVDDVRGILDGAR